MNELVKKTSMQRAACIIAGRRFGDSLCLIKNRDRAYDADLEIVHLEKNGVEMAFIFDTVTGYLEGVNEHGIAVVNTTLMVVRDEAEGKKSVPSGKGKGKGKKPLKSKDGPKIFRALACKNIEDAVESLRTDDGGIRGHTFVADGDKLFSIECSKNHPARVTSLDPERINTRTNHGVSYPDAGYTHGEDYVSSIVRRWEAQKRLQDVRRPETAAVALVEAIHDADSPFNPVRVTDKMRTTSQLTIDTTNPRLLLYLIPGHAKVLRTRNLLPDSRDPKIPVRVFRYRNKMEDRGSERGKKAGGRYKSKKKVKTKDGDERVVYEYSERQVAHRNRKKAERVEKLRKQMEKLQKKVREDVKSDDEKTRDLALAVGLMDETFERVGNEDSAKDGRFGVTTWRVEHVKFGRGSATISYVGKSGVEHEKKITNPRIVAALKDACADKKPKDCVLGVSAAEVNEYLKPLDVTAKDIRGFHANREMKDQLRKVRKGKLPEDAKEREEKLKGEFKKALEETAKVVGHEPTTLRSQYLVPGLEEEYMKDGSVSESHRRKSAATRSLMRTAAETGTETERRILANALVAPVLVARDRRWWLREAPNLYRVARSQERPRPHVEGVRFPPEMFAILWYEDSDNNRLPEPYPWDSSPEEARYMYSQFPNVLRESVLRLNDDGTSTPIMEMNSSFPEDLVTAMVRSGEWDVGDAIMVAAQSCERCMNVLCDHYGLEDGYPFDSEEYWESPTHCRMCRHLPHVDRRRVTAAPTYDSYVERKRREGGDVLTREQWEAKVLGRGSEDGGDREPPSREEWGDFREDVMARHGLEKFHVGYRPQDRHLSVDLISVEKDRRGQGNAGAAMRDTLDWADSNGVTVTLTPTSEFGSSKKRLEKWYRGMGFVPNKGRNKDFRFQDAMIRVPQSKTATKSDAEREDEKVEKMLRKEPKKKPPRYDLRDNRTLDEDDEDDLGGGDNGDRDLSMKWNKVARRVAFRWAAVGRTAKGTFEDWVKDQKFKHPETGNDVGFMSLPPDEQKKIREKWKGQQQAEEEGAGGRGEAQEEERTVEDIKVELDQAREEMREIEGDIEDLEDDLKGLRAKLKQQKQYAENMSGSAAQKMADAIRDTKREIGKKKDEIEDKKEEFSDAEKRVKELRAERKDPGFAKAKREEQLKKERAKKVQRAVSRAQDNVTKLLGKGSEIPKELKGEISEALNGLDSSQIEAFSTEFGSTLKELKGLDPNSPEAVEVAARATKFGDLYGLTDPSDLATRLAQISYAQNVVGNPMNVGGTPVGVTEMTDDKYSERAKAAFQQFEKLPSSLRRRAAEKVKNELQGLDPETNRAIELNAILTGMDVAHIAATGDSLPGRPQPSKGVADLIKKTVKDGNADQLFQTTEDFFAEQAIKKMETDLDDMSAEEIADLVTGGDPDHGYAGIAELIKDPGTPGPMRELMRSFLSQSFMNDHWGDRAVRDTMQAAGVEDADDPEVRAKIQDEARKSDSSGLKGAMAARERVAEAEAKGEKPDPEDVEKVQAYFDSEKGTGLREQAKALFDTLREKFKKVVISPATAVLNHFVQTGEREPLSQETLPHPDEGAKEPRPKEDREKARAKQEKSEEMSPEKARIERVRLKAERSKLKSQRDKVKDEEKAKFDEQIKALDEQIGKLSEPEKKPERPAGRDLPPAPEKKNYTDDEIKEQEDAWKSQTKVVKDLLKQVKDAPEGERAALQEKLKDERVKLQNSFSDLEVMRSRREEGSKGTKPGGGDGGGGDSGADEDHGPGDVWETEQGNWRAKNKDGQPKTFKSKDKAEQYAEGKPEKGSEPSKDKEEWSADFSEEVEDKGPTKFASSRMASGWLARVRSFHPDDPNRPLVVLDVA